MNLFKIKVDYLTISIVMSLAHLQLKREVSRIEISDALGMSRQNGIKYKDRPLTDEEIRILEKKLKINLSSDVETDTYIKTPSDFPGKKEIKYWGKGLPCEDKLINPGYTSIMKDRETINRNWQVDEDAIYIIAMPGDKMDGGPHPIKNGDILFVDTSSTDISISGKYFFTTNGHKDVFVANICKQITGNYEIIYANSKYGNKIVTQEQLDSVDFKVVGRIITNELFVY